MKVFSSCRGISFLVWIVAFHLVLSVSGVYSVKSTKDCSLISHSPLQRKVLERLEPLVGKNFTAEDTASNESYTYVFQLCGDAGGVRDAGVIQVDKKQKTTVIGKYTNTRAIGGSDWVMLIYESGENYTSHCNKEERKANIMISCDRNVKVSKLEVGLEERGKKEDCFYLFELDTSSVCPVIESKLSTGSIILIIGFSLLAVYLVGGFLYQRVIVGAKGVEQFPNYAFWVEFGNLTADGCDFVCRSRKREESPAYRGVATDNLQEEPEERDDHLLPM
ncbi:cation-dependent mannose-6-phosphate receptor [Pelmatolapia mariae]|uniref:cation-dependent mannose-6-phosphate receptor n=1 Tax=Pelmatolapia mariae TaxID=158779 RepID=UPI002FE5703C